MFDNRLKQLIAGFLLAYSFECGISLAHADCRPGKFHLDAVLDVPISQLSVELHDKTGCNFIFHRDYLTQTISIPAGDYQPVALTNQLAKKLNSQVSIARTVLVISPNKFPLTGTGKLVSVELNNAPVESINQIVKKLGSDKKIVSKEGSKLTASLFDVPLDDLVPILEFLVE